MIKKLLLWFFTILILAGAAFYFMNAKDSYDASKYSASVEAMQPASTMDFTLPDQFDKAHTLDASTKALVFTFSKEASHAVKAFLDTQKPDFLSEKSAYYVTDISAAPTLIRNAFILPGLKKAAYPVLLMYDPAIAAKFRDDAQKESLMIVKLDNKKIKEVLFVKEAEALTGLLK